MAAAAAFYHLPPRVLPAIQAVEGGRPGTIHYNADGSADLGLMQINTIWLVPLARVVHTEPRVVAVRLREDSCFNVAAAAAIMRLYLNEAQNDLMVAIGYYHSHTPALSSAYQRQVLGAAELLFSRKRHSGR